MNKDKNNSMSEILYQEKYDIWRAGGKLRMKRGKVIHHGIIYKSNELKATLNAQQQQNS